MTIKRINLFILLLACPPAMQAHTIEVCEGSGCTSIKTALERALPHDTILVYKGTYAEGNIRVEKPVTIKGIGFPVLDGQHTYEIVSVKSPDVNISGLKLANSGRSNLEDIAAIKIYDTHHVTITNNQLYNNFFGIYLSNSDSCTVSSNTITGIAGQQYISGNGIHLWHCSYASIKSNRVKGHRDGIYFEFVTHSLIYNNTSEHNLRYGLHFMFSDNDTYAQNTFTNNEAGVAVMYTRGVKMLNNVFGFNWGSGSYGILLKEIRDSEIHGNTFRKNSAAINMEGSNRISISGNSFLHNGWAMKIASDCEDISITKNNFVGNTFDVTSDGNPSGASFDGNYWDNYSGYDLNKDGIGDVPYYPMSLSSLINSRIPSSIIFLHSFMLDLIDQTEKLVPELIPADLRDNRPALKKFPE